MIRIFHKYKRSLVVGMVICVVCFVMTGFGLSYLKNNRHDPYAIKVDDVEITHSQFYDERRSVQDNYRRMLGEVYPKFAQNLEAHLNDQLSERLVGDTLLNKFATKCDLYVGEGQVQEMIVGEMFRGSFSPELYSNYLRQSGMSAKAFEAKLESELQRSQLTGFISDISVASKREARALFERDETSYNVSTLEFNPDNFISQVQTPSDEVLQNLYESKASELELPARVSFDYVALDPEQYQKDVDVQQDDIEFYYAENEKKFQNPEAIKARHIQLTYPKGAKPDEMSHVKDKANEIKAKLSSGEKFENLAQANSDDFITASNGGDLGWVNRGQRSKAFDEAAFKLLAGEVSEPIQTDSGYEIVKVEDRKEASPKPLEEVKAEIEATIRKREAPAYANAKGHELYDTWQKKGGSLKDFAAENKLDLKVSASMLSADSDPEAALKGLTKNVIDFPDQKSQVVELKDKIVLVEIKDFKEASPPAFSEAKQKLIDLYKKGEAKKLAEKASQDALKAFQDGKYKLLDDAAKDLKLTLGETKDLKQSASAAGIFSDEQLRKAVFGTSVVLDKPARSFETSGRFVLLQVKEIKKPDLSSYLAKEADYLKRASSQLAENTTGALVNQLKAGAQIDIDPSILTQG